MTLIIQLYRCCLGSLPMELRLCNRLVMSTGTGVCPVRLFASCHLRQCTAIDIKPVIHRWGACALGTTRVARGSMIPENIVPPTNFLRIVARQKTMLRGNVWIVPLAEICTHFENKATKKVHKLTTYCITCLLVALSDPSSL